MATSSLRLWIDVMRHLEPVIHDHERLFDAWAEGGVEGLVIGPMAFADGNATFDPDPRVYRQLGIEPPTRPTSDHRDLRRALDRALSAAKDRGWQVWIFQPGSGGPEKPVGSGPIITDRRVQEAWSARIVDTMEHYPMADGAVMDGPEWGYEISPRHMVGRAGPRSHIFSDLPESVASACAELGYDYKALLRAKDRLYDRLHNLSDREVARHGGRAGGLLGAFGLLGDDPDLIDWFAFRLVSLTRCYAAVREIVNTLSRQPIRLAAGPRSAAFAPLCGYDLPRLASILDILMPKHYFWHRGFDGLYGTVARYVETLLRWNGELSAPAALDVVGALFGIDLPDVTSLADFDAGFPNAFFERIVAAETRRVIAATGDPDRVVAWIDACRRPHEGDPISAGDLGRILDAAACAGLRRFVYHHHGNLTPGEWAVISGRCGTAWESMVQPPLGPDLARDLTSLEDYYPPDLSVL